MLLNCLRLIASTNELAFYNFYNINSFLTAIQFSAETAIHFVNVDKRKTGRKSLENFSRVQSISSGIPYFFATLIFLRSF